MIRPLSVAALCLLLAGPFAAALRCNCSNSKGTAPCRDGVCAVGDDDDDRFAACVALNHSVTGMHYACTHRDTNEQTCDSKPTKSGSTVTACFCSAVDFCNGLNWPVVHSNTAADDDQDDQDDQQVVSHASSIVRSPFFCGIILTVVLHFICR
jgi:hypothetical protein